MHFTYFIFRFVALRIIYGNSFKMVILQEEFGKNFVCYSNGSYIRFLKFKE